MCDGITNLGAISHGDIEQRATNARICVTGSDA